MIYKTFSATNVIITGAASGIGKELVRQISESNPNILAIDFDVPKLNLLKKEFEHIEILQADLSTKEGNQLILNWVNSNWHRVEFCFANAGKAEFGPFEEQNWQEMDRLFQLNVHSPIQIGMEIRRLFPNTNFRLIITASAMSFWTVPGYSMYAASKSALLQWAKTVWAEKAGNWLTLVFPIATMTNFFDTAGNNIPKAWHQQTPEWVVSEILRGTSRKKKKIFPSKLFLTMLVLNRFFRFIRKIYHLIEYRKFHKWINNQS